jgi:methyl-accepting chemotaxis protein
VNLKKLFLFFFTVFILSSCASSNNSNSTNDTNSTNSTVFYTHPHLLKEFDKNFSVLFKRTQLHNKEILDLKEKMPTLQQMHELLQKTQESVEEFQTYFFISIVALIGSAVAVIIGIVVLYRKYTKQNAELESSIKDILQENTKIQEEYLSKLNEASKQFFDELDSKRQDIIKSLNPVETVLANLLNLKDAINNYTEEIRSTTNEVKESMKVLEENVKTAIERKDRIITNIKNDNKELKTKIETLSKKSQKG